MKGPADFRLVFLLLGLCLLSSANASQRSLQQRGGSSGQEYTTEYEGDYCYVYGLGDTSLVCADQGNSDYTTPACCDYAEADGTCSFTFNGEFVQSTSAIDCSANVQYPACCSIPGYTASDCTLAPTDGCSSKDYSLCQGESGTGVLRVYSTVKSGEDCFTGGTPVCCPKNGGESGSSGSG